MYPPKKKVHPEWTQPSYARKNEIPDVMALVRIRREKLAVERESGIVLYWCKHVRESFIFFSSCCCCHGHGLSLFSHSVVSFTTFDAGCLTFISFFFLLLLSLLFSSLFSLFFCPISFVFFCFFFFLQIRATVAITLVDILERRWRGKFFQNIVVRHGRKKLLISR